MKTEMEIAPDLEAEIKEYSTQLGLSDARVFLDRCHNGYFEITVAIPDPDSWFWHAKTILLRPNADCCFREFALGGGIRCAEMIAGATTTHH